MRPGDHRRFRRAIRLQRGISLVELVITIVLIGILGSYGATMISDNMRVSLNVNSAATSADQSRYAAQRVSRELREIGYTNNATGGAYQITSTLSSNATSITFTRSISGTSNAVTLALVGTDLKLQYLPSGGTATNSVLVPNVSSFALNFYTGDNVATTTTDNVRYIVADLTVADSTSGQSITQRVRVALRNA